MNNRLRSNFFTLLKQRQVIIVKIITIVKKSYNLMLDFEQNIKEAPESLLYEGKKGKDDLQ